MVTGLNRRVTVFMDVQGAENMVKVWEKKHEEDIQAVAFHQPNVLMTASYDGDIIVWSTETNQPACRLNATESVKPMMGSERPRKMESQRSLIARKFDLARQAINPEAKPGMSPIKLGMMELLRAKVAMKQEEEEKEQEAASVLTRWRSPPQSPSNIQMNKNPLIPPIKIHADNSNSLGWKMKAPAVVVSETVHQEELPPVLPVRTPPKSQMTLKIQGILKRQGASESSVSSMCSEISVREAPSGNARRCPECFGYHLNDVGVRPIGISDHQMCCCGESSHCSSIDKGAPVPKKSATINLDIKDDSSDSNSTSDNEEGYNHQSTERPDSGFKAKTDFRNTLRILRLDAIQQGRAQRMGFQEPQNKLITPLEGPQKLITSTCVECMVALNVRKVDKKTAVVMTGGLDGWVRAWSIHYKGGLLGQFRGSHRPQDAVTCMTVDSANLYLFTADSHGYIKVWFIGDYCTKTPYTSTLTPEQNAIFVADRDRRYQFFVSNKFFRRFNARESKAAKESINPPPAASDPKRTVKKPVLLTSFRGHLKAVTCIMFADSFNIIVTGSEDHNVRVWTLSGKYIGQLGTDTWPHLEENNPDWLEENLEFQLPSDVRKVASPRTLRVLFGGVSKRWRLVKNGIMLLIGPWFRLGMKTPIKMPVTGAGKRSRSNSPSLTSTPPYYSPINSDLIIPTPRIRKPRATKEELAIPKMPYVIDVGKSAILGKSYQKMGRHKACPTYSDVYALENSVRIWPKLEMHEISEVKEMPSYGPPEVLVQREKRRAKYLWQLIQAKQSEISRAGRGRPSEEIPHNRSITIAASPSPVKAPTPKDPKSRNLFLPKHTNTDKKKISSRSKASRQNQEQDTITIDKLALEIAEILGEEANNRQS